ncbi:MAG: DM13 domain-containing protein [Candidatus Limnocylindrales bacterium]
MILGDIERLLAQLYPWRVQIAVGLAISLAVLAYIARRRRWTDVVRRHPKASTAVAAVILAVGLPVGWVLGSPLLIRTELSEDSPLAAVEASAAPETTSGPGGSPADPGPSVPPAGPRIVLQGEFQGADEFHFGSGRAVLVETAPGRYVLRFEDFSVRNGPDLFVYLSPSVDGYADGALELGGLKASDGSFNYDLPAGTDVSRFRSAVVWCRAFSVQFATAPLAAR